MKSIDKKDIIKYFRSNIYESLSSYNAWKMICYSKSNQVVSNEMAERYVEIQKYHPEFFISAERAFLVSFILTILHSFDRRDDSLSLYKVDEKETEKFVNNNIETITALKKVRNKVFAHREIMTDTSKYQVPSILELDSFFKNLIKFYNQLSKKIEDSSTMFDNAESIKRSIESLFMNLYRGETIRKKEIEIEWLWDKDKNKASELL